MPEYRTIDLPHLMIKWPVPSEVEAGIMEIVGRQFADGYSTAMQGVIDRVTKVHEQVTAKDETVRCNLCWDIYPCATMKAVQGIEDPEGDSMTEQPPEQQSETEPVDNGTEIKIESKEGGVVSEMKQGTVLNQCPDCRGELTHGDHSRCVTEPTN